MTLDPQAQYVLDLAAKSGQPAYFETTAAEARRFYREGRKALQPPAPEVAEVRDTTCSGAAGPIRLRIYRPIGAPEAPMPVLVYYHGGGWTIGDLDSHDVVCRCLANAATMAVVSVDYRLAPEHKFPAAVEDAFAALQWAAANAASFGGDGSRLAVGGDSAGGTLAAVAALLARDTGAPRIGFQLLIYPATDMAADTPSHSRCAEGYLLTRRNIDWFSGNYLRGAGDIEDWRASPLRAADLRRLPPALILTAGYDPLADEGRAYAERLAQAGVPATHRHYPGMIHGFITMGGVIDAAGQAIADAAAALLGALGG